MHAKSTSIARWYFSDACSAGATQLPIEKKQDVRNRGDSQNVVAVHMDYDGKRRQRWNPLAASVETIDR